MEKNANLHRDTDGSVAIAGEMGDVTVVVGVKGAAEKCKNSEASLSTLVNVSSNNSTANAPSAVQVIPGVEKSDSPEVVQVVSEEEGEKKNDTDASGSSPGSGDQISNGMGHDCGPAAEDKEGGASKLVNNKSDGASSHPAPGSAAVPTEVCEPAKLHQPTQLGPDNAAAAHGGDRTLSEGFPSGSDPDPSLGAESRSIDSLESFSNLNSCPSSDLNSEGLEDRGLALALHSEYGPDGTKASCAKDRSAGQSIYHIKWIKWREENTPIITQNENGPCPLLAIMNVLLLAWKVNVKMKCHP